MYRSHKTKDVLSPVLKSYITCLDSYFSTLHEVCKLAKYSSLSYSQPKESVILEVLERLIHTGKNLQSILHDLQREDMQI